MNAKEAELVTEELISTGRTYNLCPGGRGGWGYIIKNRLNQVLTEKKRQALKKNGEIGRKSPKREAERYKEALRQRGVELAKNPLFTTKGFTYSDESKQKMSNAAKKRNSGTFWITNGLVNKKTREEIPQGWWKGRVMKP